jgi:NADPH:quinone reductase-like Zn-dependent oxidoreductase
MKAVVQSEYGSPDVLKFTDIDKPVVMDDEVLVRVHAAAVNPPDWAGVHGVPYIVRLAFGLRRPKLGVRGTDMAGIVDSVGKNATRLRVGDEVFGRGVGTFAEYAVAPEQHLVPKPASITFEQAAAVPMSGLTALQALRDSDRSAPTTSSTTPKRTSPGVRSAMTSSSTTYYDSRWRTCCEF